MVPSWSLEPKVIHQSALPLTRFTAKGNHAEDDELISCCRVPSVMVSGLVLGAVKLLDECIVDLLMTFRQMFNAGWLNVSWFKARVVRKNRGEAFEAVFRLQPPFQTRRKIWVCTRLLPHRSPNQVFGFGLKDLGRTTCNGVNGVKKAGSPCFALFSKKAQLV